MRVVDVDSHFYEPRDWLGVVDPELGEAVPSITFLTKFTDLFNANAARVPFLESTGGIGGIEDYVGVLLGPEVVPFVLEAEEIQPRRFSVGEDPFYDAEARLRICDEHGIDVQFVNPSISAADSAARLHGRADLVPRTRGIWNRFAAHQLQGHTDRLMPVTQIDFSDVEWSVAELSRMREQGSRAFSLVQQFDRSMSHPDFEPIWSAAEDLGMAAYVHAGYGGYGFLHQSLVNNGGDPFTAARINRFFFQDPLFAPLGPQMLLASFALDGVFERHPKLAVIISECGQSWIPNLLMGLDWDTGNTRYRGEASGAAPSGGHAGLRMTRELKHPYRLPLRPSEYIIRQVRVSPLIGNVDVAPGEATRLTRTAQDLAELGADEMLVFSSDYCHPEGRMSAVALYDEYFPLEGAERERFFGASVADLVGL